MGSGPASASSADCAWNCRDHMTCRMARVRESLPVHYFDCDSFQIYNYGLRQGECDCTATADMEALLADLDTLINVVIDKVAEQVTRERTATDA